MNLFERCGGAITEDNHNAIHYKNTGIKVVINERYSLKKGQMELYWAR